MIKVHSEDGAEMYLRSAMISAIMPMSKSMGSNVWIGSAEEPFLITETPEMLLELMEKKDCDDIVVQLMSTPEEVNE